MLAGDVQQLRLAFDVAAIQHDLDRRRPGQSRLVTHRDEDDIVEVLSGVFEGRTTGTPIALVVRNKDARSGAYDQLRDVYRPSHADYTYDAKYGGRDHRGGGRSSARETIGRVAAGAIARTLLREIAAAAALMVTAIENARRNGDSLGGVVECVVRNCPVGLGEPVFDRLHADLGKGVLSLPACKGFEIGSGFAGTRLTGLQHNDPFVPGADGRPRTTTNNSGGVQGGISNGETIAFRAAFKPTATISSTQNTVDRDNIAVELAAKGRHDPCVLPRAVPMVEAMTLLVLADHWLRQRALDVLPR